MTEANEEMVTLADAAKDLGVSVPTFYRALGKENIPTFKKIGDRRAYVRVSDVEKLRGYRKRDEGKEAA